MRRSIVCALALALSLSMVAMLPNSANAKTPEGAPPDESRASLNRLPRAMKPMMAVLISRLISGS